MWYVFQKIVKSDTYINITVIAFSGGTNLGII